MPIAKKDSRLQIFTRSHSILLFISSPLLFYLALPRQHFTCKIVLYISQIRWLALRQNLLFNALFSKESLSTVMKKSSQTWANRCFVSFVLLLTFIWSTLSFVSVYVQVQLLSVFLLQLPIVHRSLLLFIVPTRFVWKHCRDGRNLLLYAVSV